jgi:hypothetical protein
MKKAGKQKRRVGIKCVGFFALNCTQVNTYQSFEISNVGSAAACGWLWVRPIVQFSTYREHTQPTAAA